MNKIVLILIALILVSGSTTAQRGKIVTEPVTPHMLVTGAVTTNSVSAGLISVPRQTNVYLSARNIGNTDPIVSATFTLPVRPSGSGAVITLLPNSWATFVPDVNGAYTVGLNITTATGSHDTTLVIYSANFRGVGPFDGITNGTGCMTCHGAGSSIGDFTAIYNNWAVSSHAQMFKTMITTGAAYYSTSCMKCHTTGYDHNVTAANNGFDDVAVSLGWNWVGPPNPGKWDSLKTGYPGLVRFATIGCENCHGPGSSHPGSQPGSAFKTRLVESSGNCGQCHDEPWRHNRYAQWENSLHSEAVWSNSFAQGTASQNNTLQNCIRCHDGQGYINFTKGLTTNTTGWTSARQSKIGCATCHDPHGNGTEYSLRNTPALSDTLGNGYQYTVGGKGRTCMNCHKARRDNVSYIAGSNTVGSTWGPHYSVQADVLLGKNAASFGTAYLTNSHQFAITDACVTCHMVATTDTATVTRDKVGQHSFKLYDQASNYYHTTACTPCHGTITNWNSFMALMDYDGDGTIEGIPDEIDGLLTNIRVLLPPTGLDSISTALITSMANVDIRKAYWNYRLIYYDGSKGMHNSKFTLDVLMKTKVALGAVVPVELTSFTTSIEKNDIILNWETGSETNNSGFDIERKSGDDWTKIGFVPGAGTTTEVMKYTFKDSPKNLTGIISYRLKQVDYDGAFTYSKSINVDVSSFSPASYSISQNYPNPFNPSTVINYSLPYESNVKITIYNVNGEVVNELVNGVGNAGNHEITFSINGLNLSSGVYFYSIRASSLDGKHSFQQTKKMVLIK